MKLEYTLNQIRMPSNRRFTIKRKLCYALLAFVFGVFTGILSKFLEAIPHIGSIGSLINIFTDICSDIGLWVFIATIISAWSSAPKSAALHVLLFFIGMLLSYYIYSGAIFHFFPLYYFLRWTIIAIFTPIPAFGVWYSRGNGWIASLAASLPIALLIVNGYSFFYTRSLIDTANIIFAVILYIALPKNSTQRLLIIPFAVIVFLLLSKLDIISIVFGGL